MRPGGASDGKRCRNEASTELGSVKRANRRAGGVVEAQSFVVMETVGAISPCGAQINVGAGGRTYHDGIDVAGPMEKVGCLNLVGVGDRDRVAATSLSDRVSPGGRVVVGHRIPPGPQPYLANPLAAPETSGPDSVSAKCRSARHAVRGAA